MWVGETAFANASRICVYRHKTQFRKSVNSQTREFPVQRFSAQDRNDRFLGHYADWLL